MLRNPQDTADLKYSRPTKVIFTSAMLFTFLVSVIGNSLVIYVIAKHRSMRTSTNWPHTVTYKLSSKWVVKIGIPVIWLMSALLSINSVLITKIVHDRTPKCIMSEDSYQEHYISTPCFIVSLLVLIVLYSIIAYRLWRRKIPGEVSSNQHVLAIRTARKVTVLMISVVIVFFVSWAPAFALVFFNFIDSMFAEMLAMKYPFLFAVSYWLILNSSACNPYLYFIFIESFRQSLKSACFRCRAPELRQERRIETEQPMNKGQTLNNFTRKERAIELTAYTTV
ncbi:substance-K receptor-like [Oculina patagonica]